MGGIATDLWGRSTLAGLYAAGEVASAGVHGANRLASNSLLEALVFGRRAATAMKQQSPHKPPSHPPRNAPAAIPLSSFDKIRDTTWRNAGIVRNAAGLKKGLELLSDIREPSNLLTVASVIHECALAREESRGAHFRDDFPSTASSKLHSYIKKDARVSLR